MMKKGLSVATFILGVGVTLLGAAVTILGAVGIGKAR